MKVLNVFALFAIVIQSCATSQPSTTQVRGIYKQEDKELSAKPEPLDKEAFEQWLYENNKQLQPSTALKGFGKVTLVMTVDENGNVIQPLVWRGIGDPYDSEAQRLLKEVPLKWKPGIVKGKDVKVLTYYTVSFQKKE